MGQVFVGVVAGQPPDTVTVGIIQDDGRRVTGNSFTVAPARLDEYYVQQPQGRHRYDMPADLVELGTFLNETISPDSRVRYLFEVPDTVPHPLNDPGAIPHPVLRTDAVVLKVLVMLGVNDIIAAPFR